MDPNPLLAIAIKGLAGTSLDVNATNEPAATPGRFCRDPNDDLLPPRQRADDKHIALASKCAIAAAKSQVLTPTPASPNTQSSIARVIRFTYREIETNLESVLAEIAGQYGVEEPPSSSPLEGRTASLGNECGP